jgi:AraC-like DNA-binding protein
MPIERQQVLTKNSSMRSINSVCGRLGDDLLGSGGASTRTSPAVVEVVCGNPTTLKLTIARIRCEGHEVCLVLRAQEACARKDLIQPDLVLLDARQNLVDSAQLCHELGRNRGTGEAELLVILNPEQKVHRGRFIVLGATDCVSCGDDPEEVALRVQALLLRRSRALEPLVRSDEEVSPLVSAVCDYLLKHLSKPVGMEDLERRFGKARKTLNQAFEGQLGITVFAWFRRRKMAYAAELLVKSDMGVEEIAKVLGYASVCNFSTAFRLSHGVSPRRYRYANRSQPFPVVKRSLPAWTGRVELFEAQSSGLGSLY